MAYTLKEQRLWKAHFKMGKAEILANHAQGRENILNARAIEDYASIEAARMLDRAMLESPPDRHAHYMSVADEGVAAGARAAERAVGKYR